VRRDLVHAARLLLAPTFALVVVALFLPGRLEICARVYALLVCAAALVVVLRALRRAYPPERPLLPRAKGRAAPRRPPQGLARIEHEAALGVAGAFDLHFRLRPRLHDIAAGLLQARRRISLDDEPDAARAALGDATWQLVRADRPPPEDRLGRGLPPAELIATVDSLERV
jgi:hypothetical protein